MNISSILQRVKEREYTLPEFQREFVWTNEKIENFFNSLYRGYPVGGLITWRTSGDHSIARSKPRENVSPITYILDGQQRITTIYSIKEGETPHFYDGEQDRFEDFYFDIDTERFNFVGQKAAAENIRLFRVTDIFNNGETYYETYEDELKLSTKDSKRISKVINILTKELYYTELDGAQYDLRTVIEIFNEVNRGGTQLSAAHLALSKLYFIWPECRNRLLGVNSCLSMWQFRVELLLRCLTITTKKSWAYSSLDDVDFTKEELDRNLKIVTRHLVQILDLIKSHLGIDWYYVLRSHNSLPIMVHYFNKFRTQNISTAGYARLLGWYLHTAFWRRFTGKSDGFFQKELNIVTDSPNWSSCLDKMYEELRLSHGNLQFHPGHFDVSQINSSYYPIIYILMRTGNALDLGNRRIRLHISVREPLHRHHIFPKTHLREYSKKEINSLANFAFITQSTNLEIGSGLPCEYLERIDSDILESQWIPGVRNLWKIENYLDFLAKRRQFLADAANKLLSNLEAGILPSEA